MSENIFWVYNGWAILITVLGPLYTILQANLRGLQAPMRAFFPIFFIGSIVGLLVLSDWITALLYVPAVFLGIGLANTLESALGIRS